jgi:hypothetical protein
MGNKKGPLMRAVSVLPILAVLSFATAALADPPSNVVMKTAPTELARPSADAKIVCRQRYEIEVAGLGQLGVQLKLTAAQKPHFDTWKKSMLDLQKAVPCPPPSIGLDTPAPKRVENEIAIMTATLDGLHKELGALKALYADLTPDQRAVLDGPMHMSAPPPAAPPASAPPSSPTPPPAH